MSKIQEVLLNTYLDLSREGSDLRDMAYVKAIMWVLFAEGKPLDVPTIANNIAQLVGSSNLPINSISKALGILGMRKLAFEKKGNWELSPLEKSNMQRQIQHSIDITSQILIRRFPNLIEKQKLQNWFDDANSQYFSAGANKLIALYTSHQKPLFNVESVIKPIIKKHGLSKYEKELLQGYREFLTSDDREEGEKIMNLMRSLLSSKLVSVNISPEILNIERYKNAEMLLDTNVLFAMRLYRGDELDQAFKAFGKVMNSLGIKLFITDFTKEEYEKVRIGEKGTFLTLIKNYSKGIFEGISQNNDIAKSVLRLECANTEDIERFFDITLKMPEEIGGAKINVLGGNKIIGSDYVPDADKVLFSQIQEATRQRSGTKKRENAAIHDVRLMKLALKKNSAKKTFVLTLDGAMEALALEKVGDKEEPLWISLYSLVQILAINGAGPDFNPNDLAPFIKMFMEFEEATKEEKYDERDLLLVIEKTNRVNEISETKAISLLNKMHRVKLRRSPEEAVREMVLELDRTLRQDATKTDTALKNKQTEIDNLVQEKGEKEKQLKGVNSELKTEKIKKVIFLFCLRIIVYSLLITFLIWYLKGEMFTAYSQNLHYNLVSIIAVIVGVVCTAVGDYFSYTSLRIKEINSN